MTTNADVHNDSNEYGVWKTNEDGSRSCQAHEKLTVTISKHIVDVGLNMWTLSVINKGSRIFREPRMEFADPELKQRYDELLAQGKISE